MEKENITQEIIVDMKKSSKRRNLRKRFKEAFDLGRRSYYYGLPEEAFNNWYNKNI